MLERKRQAKHYRVVPNDEEGGRDVELGEGLDRSEETETNRISRSIDHDDQVVDGWGEDGESVPVENGAQRLPGETRETNG